MEFRIADTFTDSLARLTGEEQKAVKTTAFDLQLNPAAPGLSFHKLDRARDKNFWSVRVNADIRLIVHRTVGSLLLCYVDHHDKAYGWAERRKLELHPKTGAAQLVEIRETVREITVPTYVQKGRDGSRRNEEAFLFAGATDDELLGYGVPPEWLADVRKATDSSLLSLADHLPSEAAEALLELATGGKPRRAAVIVHQIRTVDHSTPMLGERPAAREASDLATSVSRGFAHPDARRRFRMIDTPDELRRALDYPWDKWTIFLHPEQREWAERDYSGPARISGSAGTGKTIVAVHRAAHLARVSPNGRVLLTTLSDPLARALQVKLRRLLAGEPRLGERIDVLSLPSVGVRLYRALVGSPMLASAGTLKRLVSEAATRTSGHSFGLRLLLAEWEQVVDAWQLGSWEAYRDVARLGRKTRLAESQRRTLWTIFERVRAGLSARGEITESQLFATLADEIDRGGKVIYDFAVIDESQDLSVSQLRCLAALGGGRANGLFFAGDLGQRIFQQAFSWKALGVDIQGRSRTLRVNYRTSHQIRTQADRLLGPVIEDVDGQREERYDTVSVFNGPAPVIETYSSEDEEIAAVGEWLTKRSRAGIQPHEIGVFVRSTAQRGRAERAVQQSGLAYRVLDEALETASGEVSICTMSLAKGLEFRAVAVIACDDEVIPLQERIEGVGDDADLREVYDTERHLLYVACTRARDQLLVTGLEPHSEFLDDLTRGELVDDCPTQKA